VAAIVRQFNSPNTQVAVTVRDWVTFCGGTPPPTGDDAVVVLDFEDFAMTLSKLDAPRPPVKGSEYI
jgi:hypothetical protein